MTSTETFVAGLIESAYENLECVANEDYNGPHSDETAALYRAHGCIEGMICRGHLEHVIQDRRRELLRDLKIQGYVQCGWCEAKFATPEAFETVYVL